MLHIDNNLVIPNQWRNWGRVPPRDFWPGNSADLLGKERQGKMEQKRRKIEKGKMEKWKWKEEKLQNAERTFFFLFCCSLFKTTEICFGSTKIGIFYREKAFYTGKEIGKDYFVPSEKCSSYAPVPNSWLTIFILQFNCSIHLILQLNRFWLTCFGNSTARGGHSNGKRGYKARPWTHKEHPNHVFFRYEKKTLNTRFCMHFS